MTQIQSEVLHLAAFKQQVQAAQRRVVELHLRALQTSACQNDLLTSSLEELNTVMQQMRLAEEMLSQPSDQLSSASDVAAFWRHRYEDFFNFAPDACLVTGPDGRIQEANRAAADLLNVEQNALVGRFLIDYIAEGEGPAFRSKLSTLQDLPSGESWEQRTQAWDVILCPHGRTPIQASLIVKAVVLTIPDHPPAWCWLLRAVSEDQAVTPFLSGLERSEIETKLMNLFHADIIGITVGEGDFITDANGCFLSMIGYSNEDLPLNWKSLTPPKQHLRSVAAIQEATATGTASPYEKEFISKEGRHVPAIVGGCCLKKEPCQYISFVLDITNQKRREERLAADYTRDHRIAETFEDALLPDVSAHSFPRLVVETRYEAAWEEARVGGDFYDAFALEDGKIALVVGDVAGKGLAAAVYALEIKSALRAFLREHSHPATALPRLNAFIYDRLHLDDASENGQGDPFTTLALAVVEADTGKTAFAVAGAEPPLVIRANGTMEVVNAGMLLLGIEAKLKCEATEVTLHPGDRLLMVTDGITEARSGPNFLDYDGLVALVEQSLSQETQPAMIQAILNGARAFAGGALADDACLLIAQRL